MIRAYERLVQQAQVSGTDLKAAAVQFPLRHPHVASLVIGASSAAEVEENLAALTRTIPGSFWATID